MQFPAILLLIGLCPSISFCQAPAIDSNALPGGGINTRTIEKLTGSYAGLNKQINTGSLQLLQRLQKKEASLKKDLQGKDSAAADQIFANSGNTYTQLEEKLKNPVTIDPSPIAGIRNYIPGIDSMTTAIGFLSKTGLPIDKLQKLQALNGQLTQLQGSLQNANEIQTYITQRTAQLQDQLSQFGMAKELSGIGKTVFYYRQQVSQYKGILNDPQQQQQLILSTLRQLPAFQNFWQKNSMLAQLFPAPGNNGTLLAGAGLQTNAQVGKIIQQKLGTAMDDGGQNASQYLQQQVGDAQGQMDQLKNKLDKLDLGAGSSNMTLPDMTPNSQRQKTFLKRLELGFNIQNNSATALLPTISTIGLSLGYKLSDKATIGIGVSYLLGLGNSLNKISLSNQGAGLRSFLDIRGYKSIWITGGWEYNYMQAFATLKSIDNLDLWQKSALLGLTKKFNVGKHSGNLQLLYDFLAQQQIPAGQPLKFRFGFGL
jgi:hypothetical protein